MLHAFTVIAKLLNLILAAPFTVIAELLTIKMLSVALSLCLLFAAVCGQTKLSGADKQELLEAHNHFRSKVNPIATNMEMMVTMTSTE